MAVPGVLLTYGNGATVLGWYLGQGTPSVSARWTGSCVVSSAPWWEALRLARFNADGTADGSFGTDNTLGNLGVVTTVDPSLPDAYQVDALVLQPDDKLLAAGETVAGFGPGPTTNRQLAIARYNSDGTLDATFGSVGLVVRNGASPTALMLAADGSIVVAGANFIGAYDSNGANATLSCESLLTTSEAAVGAVLQADGKVVTLAPAPASGAQPSFELARFLSPVVALTPPCP